MNKPPRLTERSGLPSKGGEGEDGPEVGVSGSGRGKARKGGAVTGMIEGLPKAQRDQINEMLRDGVPGEEIVRKAQEWGYGLTAADLAKWRKGGYADWRREQQRLEEMREMREFALEAAQANEGKAIEEAGLQMAAAQIYELLSQFDYRALQKKMKEPLNYARLIGVLAKLGEGGLRFARHREEVAQARRQITAELKKAQEPGGLTRETIEKIERELRLF